MRIQSTPLGDPGLATSVAGRWRVTPMESGAQGPREERAEERAVAKVEAKEVAKRARVLSRRPRLSPSRSHTLLPKEDGEEIISE